MLKTLVLLNDSYAHESLKIDLHMLPGGIDHQSVFVIAQLPIQLTCIGFQEKWLIEISKGQHRASRQAFLSISNASWASL